MVKGQMTFLTIILTLYVGPVLVSQLVRHLLSH